MAQDVERGFGELLREYRLRSGYSQEQLAETARVSAAAVSALERGSRRAPYRDTVAALAEALRLTPEERSAFGMSAERGRARKRERPRTNAHLPAQRNAFVGRRDDVAKIAEHLRGSRLVTITGSGGIGKTRAALEVAVHSGKTSWDSVCFADLTPLANGTLIAGTIGAAIRPPLEKPSETVPELVSSIAERNVLLVLDNCEHLLIDVAACVHALLQGCPRVAIVATSRERLHLTGETLYRLPPLTIPDHLPRTALEAEQYSALELFIERTRLHEQPLDLSAHAIAMLVDICRRLEGLPLAIELAAARLPLLGLKTLHARLGEHFGLPGAPHDLPDRQQTMQATIAWSYDLLTAEERESLCRFAVFSGGFTLEAAEAVCAYEPLEERAILLLIASLVDKSLVNVTHVGDNVRYTLLDSVRSFARDRLQASGRFVLAARRHAEWLADLADQISIAHMSAERFTELEPDLDNVRAAVTWALDAASPHDCALAGRIVFGLHDLWSMSGRRSESRNWSGLALARIDESLHPDVTAKLLRAHITRTFNEPTVFAAIERAVPLYDRLGDDVATANLHALLTFIFSSHGRLDDAERCCRRAASIFEEKRLTKSQAFAGFLYNRAMLREMQEKFDDARADVAESEKIASSFDDRYFIAFRIALRRLWIEYHAGNYQLAIAIVEEMAASEFKDNPEVRRVANEAGAMLYLLIDDTAGAARTAREVLRLVPCDDSLVIEYVAGIAALREQWHVAARFIGFIDALLERVPNARDMLQQQTRDRLYKAVAANLTADVLATWCDEGRQLSAEAVKAEAIAALEAP